MAEQPTSVTMRADRHGVARVNQKQLGNLFPVSTLTLGGGGLGMLWGQTTEAECIATVRAAIDAGINLLDLAPRCGDGKLPAMSPATQRLHWTWFA